jgi:hypothetical protein
MRLRTVHQIKANIIEYVPNAMAIDEPVLLSSLDVFSF